MTSGRSRLAAALLLAWLGCAQAKDWGLPQLMQELRGVPSAEADFVERRYLAVLDAPLEVSGTLAYQAPGRLEKRTLEPKTETLIVEGDTLTLEDPADGRKRSYALQRQPVVRGFVEGIRSTLAGDLQTLQRFYDVSLEGSDADWRLRLRPSEPAMREAVVEILIGGRGAAVRSVEIRNPGGDRSVMTITSRPR